jgi:putative hydroxymethylpyrimidine transporter CytX
MAVAAGPVEPEWGIDPVPTEARRLSGFDLAVLWGDLGIGLLVLVTGALLVPALGFAQAFGVIVIGSAIGVALLALVGAAGTADGVPTMVLFRPILGRTGSYLPSVLNVAQLIGWTAVELWAISFVADLVAVEAFGFEARGLWLVAAALICTALALWGPVGVTRVWMERFGAWMILGICGALTVLVLSQDGIGAALGAPGQGSWPTIGSGLDLVIAMPISWLPLVADYNRFAKTTRGSFGGTFTGYLIANVWLYTLGALLILGAGADPSPAGIAGGILAVAGGTVAGLLFLVGLLAGETDEAFADIYSGAMSMKNVFPRVPRSAFVIAIAIVSTALAGWLTMERYESFLFLIGSVFVPLFGVFVAERYLRAGTGDQGHGLRAGPLVAWAVGFLVYHWIAPTGPAWWIDWLGGIAQPLSADASWLSASVPSFVAAGATALALRPLSSPRTRAER